MERRRGRTVISPLLFNLMINLILVSIEGTGPKIISANTQFVLFTPIFERCDFSGVYSELETFVDDDHRREDKTAVMISV